MDWILIILFHLVFFALCGGCGLLVVVIIGNVFEKITGYLRTQPKPSQAQLKREIEKIEDSELAYELRLLLAERRMGQWWKFLVWLIVSSVLYCWVFWDLFKT